MEDFCVGDFTLRGGFITLSRNFKTSDVVSMLEKNPEKGLRLGLSKELLSFWQQKGSRCPASFVALDFGRHKFLAVSDGRSKVGTGSMWDKSFAVFVVEC